ncbi:hypothetical protein ACFYNY_34655 [Streptomyces sp. NPDC006530]|uniref:hypothetical protein n=1 Tax=Streptomyces sp. NPDC006530 TaxID=3364750 RepID=UPI0036BC46E8
MTRPENPFNTSLTFVGSFQMQPAEMIESLPVRQLLQWALTTAARTPDEADTILPAVTAELVARDELQLAAVLLAQLFSHSQQSEEDGDAAAAAYRELQHGNHIPALRVAHLLIEGHMRGGEVEARRMWAGEAGPTQVAFGEWNPVPANTVRWLLVLTCPVAGYPRARIGALIRALELVPAAV